MSRDGFAGLGICGIMLANMSQEKPKRSLLKTLSWRSLATITTILLVYVFTGEIVLALEVGFIEVFAKLLLYYLHERMWNRIKWGTIPETVGTE